MRHDYVIPIVRRSLAAQQRARQKEVLAQTKSMQNSISVGRRALQVPRGSPLILRGLYYTRDTYTIPYFKINKGPFTIRKNKC